MRRLVLLTAVASLCLGGCISRDEVLRRTSPDGHVDAIVFETDCGAVCSFGYEIRLAPKGAGDGQEVASLDAALRSEQAWGVNLKWSDNERLSVEYLRADYSQVLRQVVEIDGRKIKVTLRGGINDPQAPPGGMLFNAH
jgi:hypothetical protein